MRYSLVLCTLMLAVGCAENQQYFHPTEHVYGRTMQGHPEAIYSLTGQLGAFGEAKVWSSGAFRTGDGALLHVQLDLHNTSGAPIIVRPENIRLDPIRIGDQLLRDVPPIEQQALSVAPGKFGRVSLSFALPAGVRAGEVSAFGLRWSVSNGPQSYAQLTPFQEDYGRYAASRYPPVYGYGFGYMCGPYDPFCGRGYYGYGYPVGGAVIVAPPAPMQPRAVIRVR